MDDAVEDDTADASNTGNARNTADASNLDKPVADSPPASVSSSLPRIVRNAIFTWWAVLVGLWLIWKFAQSVEGLLIQMLLALFISFAMEPLVDKLESAGIRRSLGAGLSLLALLAGVGAFLVVVGEMVATQLTDLADELPSYVEASQAWIDDKLGLQIDSTDLVEQFQDGGAGSKLATGIADTLVATGSTIASVLFQLLTILLFAYYFSADGPRLRRAVCSVLPPARQVEVLRIWELAISKTGAYMTSRFILGSISAIVHWVAFATLGLPSPVALAIWVGLVSQFIPTLGTYFAGVLPIAVALGVEPSKAVWVLIMIIVYQQIENYILQPKITAQTLDMHPAVSIAAVLGGTSLLGPAGALLALPLVATMQGFIGAYVHRHKVIENHLTREDPERNRG